MSHPEGKSWGFPLLRGSRAPLARSTLIQMGVRIAVIIALTTFFSYLHMYRALRAQALAQLEQHVADRAQREQAIFLLAGDNLAILPEHLGDIVKVQQNYARTPRVHEPVQLAELVEDALRINAAGLTRHQVKVVRELASLPPVLTDKHKVLMILVNLVSNAKYALDGVSPAERLLSVKMERTGTGEVRIEVHDNGMGIAPAMLNRIFQYGFTTREEGHGFGLHSSGLAAQELGGALTVHSKGPGHGATFILELPGVMEETA